MKFCKSVLDAIGNTPLIRLNKVAFPGGATVLAKAEIMNPGGSVKDRMALYILEQAEKSGLLKPGGTIVENTSGNTGVGVAIVAAVKGYRCIFTMPDKMSTEKINFLKAFGAEVVVTPTNVPADSPQSYYETAKRIARETPNAFYLNQYHNPMNIQAHYKLTGPELWKETGGRIDVFVSGIGTGGTMSGAGKFLKEKNPRIRNVAVDPEGSIYHDYFKTGKLSTPHVYKVEGIGEDMLCGAMDFTVLDDVVRVTDQQCFVMARRLAREEGLFVGGSSGGAVQVAVDAARKLPRRRFVVVILPDSGSRYLSKFHNDAWMKDNRFLEPEIPGGRVGELLQGRTRKVHTVRLGEPVHRVVTTMKRLGISQMPVVDKKTQPVGMVHEVDLLDFLLAGKHRMREPVELAMSPLQGVITPDAPLGRLNEIFSADNVAVVMENGKVQAVLTKMDMIDHLAQKMR
jgi:cystathionine beta-synthase